MMWIFRNAFAHKWHWPALLCLLFTLNAFPISLQAQDTLITPRIRARVLYDDVAVRSGPGYEFTLLGRLSADEVTTVTGRNNENGNWLRVRLGGIEGWIWHFALQLSDDPATLRIVEPVAPVLIEANPSDEDTENILPPDEAMTVKVFRAVNVRSGPGVEYAELGELLPGDVVVVVARNGLDTTWLQVDLEGRYGWVAYFTVSLSGNPDDLPVYISEDVPVVSVTEAPPREPARQVESGDVIAEAYRTVNVRSGPSMEYARINQLQIGDRVLVIGRSDEGNNWLLVDLGREDGWVAYFTVTVIGNPDLLEVISMEDES